MYYFYNLDKQQELDIPSLHVEDAVERTAKKKDRPKHAGASTTMSQVIFVSFFLLISIRCFKLFFNWFINFQIQGVKRALTHTNSFTGEKLPKYGVESNREEELGRMLTDVDKWGIDIFRVGELTNNRPLTCIAYTAFTVIETKDRLSFCPFIIEQQLKFPSNFSEPGRFEDFNDPT